MTTVSGSRRVYAFWNRQRRAYVMYMIYLSLSIHGRRAYYFLPNGGWDEDERGYFDSVGGCWTTRTPAIRAGLNDRSQSAYAAPAPKPVERAIGHARPEINFILEWMEVRLAVTHGERG
jgi:hypothetical protein